MSQRSLVSTRKARSRISAFVTWLCFAAVIVYSTYKATALSRIIERQQETIIAQQVHIERQQAQLDDRLRWMNELTKWIAASVADRWTLTNSRTAWKQVFNANPGMNEPERFLPYVHVPHEPVLPNIPH